MAFSYAVNCSILFTELPLTQRAAAAQRAGFDAVEFWWPFPVPIPPATEVDDFVASINDADVKLVGLNFFAGDMPGGERGVLSDPARTNEFRDNLDVAMDIAERVGCQAFNALYGNRVEDVAEQAQDDTALENLQLAARAAARVGGTVLVEPISGSPRYPLKTAAEAVRVVDMCRARGADNVAFLYDAYHLAANGDDVFAAIENYYDRFGHVQIADNPGRNEPGTGALDVYRIIERLRERGWDRYVALEYKPSGETVQSFAWLPAEHRGLGRG